MLKQQLISQSKYDIKCPYTMTPKGICIHNTANDATAANEIAYMQSNNNEVSFHIAVDDKEAIQGLPFNRNAWHAGDGAIGEGNRNYIAIEICYSKSGGDKFINAEKRAAKEVAALLKQYGWGVDKVKKHQDFSNKYCPHRTLDMGWQRFLNMIKLELSGSNQTGNSNVEVNYNVGDKIKIVGSNYATGEMIPGWVKENTYEVIQVSNNKVLLGGIMSWIYTSDVQKVNNTVNSVIPQVSNKKYLNLEPHMQKWAIYKENGPYTKSYKIGDVKPTQFSGLSYEILGNPMTDVYIIQTRDFGRVGIWAPRDNDSTITDKSIY